VSAEPAGDPKNGAYESRLFEVACPTPPSPVAPPQASLRSGFSLRKRTRLRRPCGQLTHDYVHRSLAFGHRRAVARRPDFGCGTSTGRSAGRCSPGFAGTPSAYPPLRFFALQKNPLALAWGERPALRAPRAKPQVVRDFVPLLHWWYNDVRGTT
jgi:hypothetical protein